MVGLDTLLIRDGTIFVLQIQYALKMRSVFDNWVSALNAIFSCLRERVYTKQLLPEFNACSWQRKLKELIYGSPREFLEFNCLLLKLHDIGVTVTFQPGGCY